MFTPIPDDIPRSPRGTLKAFKTVQFLFDFFNAIEPSDNKINNGDMTYKQLLDYTYKNHINATIEEKNVDWLGEPLPESVEDAMARDRYLNMAEFNYVYRNTIQPRLQELLKKSSAELEMPTLKYNELGLGMFDFNKASAGLIPLYKYYSFKKKAEVEGNEVETYQDKDKYRYRLKSDGSPVVLVPKIKDGDKKNIESAYKEIYDGKNVFEVLRKRGLKIGGKEAFTSTIKKSYLLKEKVPKPKNAIRIFVSIDAGVNITSEQYKWTGYAAIGIAELLSVMGYAVNIIGILGYRSSINIDNKLDEGYRFLGVNLKSFEDTLDKQSLLYICSDATFLRVKMFDLFVKIAQYYNDYLNTGLGGVPNKYVIENMIFSEYGKRDLLFNPNGKKNNKSQFLYYVVSDIYNEEQVSQAILKIGLDVVNKNREAREKLLGL